MIPTFNNHFDNINFSTARLVFLVIPLVSFMLSNVYIDTECPKIYRKSVLHLLKYTVNLYLIRCSTDLR